MESYNNSKGGSHTMSDGSKMANSKMKSYDQATALRGFTKTDKKSPTGTATIGGSGGGG